MAPGISPCATWSLRNSSICDSFSSDSGAFSGGPNWAAGRGVLSKTDATIAKVFLDHCIERHVKGELDTVTASMAKYRLTDTQGKVIDRCLQLFGGYGYMDEYPISRMYRDARVLRIYAGTNEIMKLLIARSL